MGIKKGGEEPRTFCREMPEDGDGFHWTGLSGFRTTRKIWIFDFAHCTVSYDFRQRVTVRGISKVGISKEVVATRPGATARWLSPGLFSDR